MDNENAIMECAEELFHLNDVISSGSLYIGSRIKDTFLFESVFDALVECGYFTLDHVCEKGRYYYRKGENYP